eukprot:7401913-Alexandrium_andersonii.AAC.1
MCIRDSFSLLNWRPQASGVDVDEVLPIADQWEYLGLRNAASLRDWFRSWYPGVNQVAVAAGRDPERDCESIQ